MFFFSRRFKHIWIYTSVFRLVLSVFSCVSSVFVFSPFDFRLFAYWINFSSDCPMISSHLCRLFLHGSRNFCMVRICSDVFPASKPMISAIQGSWHPETIATGCRCLTKEIFQGRSTGFSGFELDLTSRNVNWMDFNDNGIEKDDLTYDWFIPAPKKMQNSTC